MTIALRIDASFSGSFPVGQLFRIEFLIDHNIRGRNSPLKESLQDDEDERVIPSAPLF